MVIALISSVSRPIPAQSAERLAGLFVRPVLPPLHALHSGDIRDYVAWLALGMAVLGGALLFALR